VDSVSEVIEIGADSIEPAPNFGASVRRDFIRGMGKVEVRRTGASRFVIILEANKAFDVGEMAQLCDEAQDALAA
jgi:purine-binding chemotaxis protein CheW